MYEISQEDEECECVHVNDLIDNEIDSAVPISVPNLLFAGDSDHTCSEIDQCLKNYCMLK